MIQGNGRKQMRDKDQLPEAQVYKRCRNLEPMEMNKRPEQRNERMEETQIHKKDVWYCETARKWGYPNRTPMRSDHQETYLRNKLAEMEMEGMIPTLEARTSPQEGQMNWTEERKKYIWKAQWNGYGE